MHSTESRCVIGLENVVFLNGVHAAVSPGILPAGAVKWLKTQEYNVDYCLMSSSPVYVFALLLYLLTSVNNTPPRKKKRSLPPNPLITNV